jgi:hypothetical protein
MRRSTDLIRGTLRNKEKRKNEKRRIAEENGKPAS